MVDILELLWKMLLYVIKCVYLGWLFMFIMLSDFIMLLLFIVFGLVFVFVYVILWNGILIKLEFMLLVLSVDDR